MICHAGDSYLVLLASRVLETDGPEVVLGRVGGGAQGFSGAALADAWCATPSRQPQPRRIRPNMGKLRGLSILTVNA